MEVAQDSTPSYVFGSLVAIITTLLVHKSSLTLFLDTQSPAASNNMAGLSISREHIAELDRICENLAGDPHYPAAFAYVVDAEGVIFEKVVGEQDVMASDRGKVTADTGKSISLQHRPYANADSWSAILHLFSMPKSMIVV